MGNMVGTPRYARIRKRIPRASAEVSADYSDALEIVNQIGIRERFIRYSIAALTITFGVVGLVSAFAPGGSAGSPVRLAVALAASASTIPAAIVVSRVNIGTVWWSKEASIKGANTAFVIYADLGVAIVLATFQNPLMALHGATLFAVIAGYVAHFVRLPVVIAHVTFTSLVIVACGIATVLLDYPVATSVYYTVVALAASNGIVVLLRTYTIDFQRAIARQLELASTDPLTEVRNRRGFLNTVASELRRGCLSGPFAIAMVDIDNFKQINDQHGHVVGDAVLIRIARSLQDIAGPSAVVGRMGGDEFAIAAPLEREEAIRMARRITEVPHSIQGDVTITMSLGISVRRAKRTPVSASMVIAIVNATLASADLALLRAKASGRAGLSTTEAPS